MRCSEVRVNYPLDLKVELSLNVIRNFYKTYNGEIYVSFSGGKDSTALLHLVRSIYPKVIGVFSNTGLEYPEIVQFVRSCQNIEWIKPLKTFKEVLDKYGYPIISKEQSSYIYELRNCKQESKEKAIYRRLTRDSNFVVSDKWKFLLDAPFKISDKCCKYLKIDPFKKFEKTTGLKPLLGNTFGESDKRNITYYTKGCNIHTKREIIKPLSFWTPENVLEYIKKNRIRISDIYKMGYERTGCSFCMFGCHMDNPNKFQLMKNTHPSLYRYCIEELKIGEVLTYCGIPY